MAKSRGLAVERMITGEQVRRARKLLGWSQEDLAGQLGVSDTTIALFERRHHKSTTLNLRELRLVLESVGIEFSESEPGVRLRNALDAVPRSSQR